MLVHVDLDVGDAVDRHVVQLSERVVPAAARAATLVALQDEFSAVVQQHPALGVVVVLIGLHADDRAAE